jgi:hypothetical protein
MNHKFLTVMISAFLLLLVAGFEASAQQRFVANLSGAQEVPLNNSAGKGVCRISLNSAETQITVNCEYSGLSGSVQAAHIHGNAAVGENAPVLFDFAFAGGSSGTTSNTFNVTAEQVADLRAQRWYVNFHTAQFPGGEIRGQIKRPNVINDLDGDGRTDTAVYRSSTDFYFTKSSLNGSLIAIPLGEGSDTSSALQLNSDYDGDGKSDYTVQRSLGGQRIWISLLSGTNQIRTVAWGAASGDNNVPADYDGDGKTDIAVYRRAAGLWCIIESSTGSPRYEQWGAGTDNPYIGDFDKDGKADLTVVRNENGNLVWYTRRSSDGGLQAVFWGLASDSYPFNIAIDVDGDGAQDRLVTRDAASGNTTYYALRSSDNQIFALEWGNFLGTRRYGDYDGDGKTDIVWRYFIQGQPNNYVWFIYQSSTGTLRVDYWGLTSDQ